MVFFKLLPNEEVYEEFNWKCFIVSVKKVGKTEEEDLYINLRCKPAMWGNILRNGWTMTFHTQVRMFDIWIRLVKDNKDIF